MPSGAHSAVNGTWLQATKSTVADIASVWIWTRFMSLLKREPRVTVMGGANCPDWPHELATIARDIAASGDNVESSVFQGLVKLVELNEGFVAKCLRASEATADVLRTKAKHESESLGLQNKRCPIAFMRRLSCNSRCL
jgi:hypothetical protein